MGAAARRAGTAAPNPLPATANAAFRKTVYIRLGCDKAALQVRTDLGHRLVRRVERFTLTYATHGVARFLCWRTAAVVARAFALISPLLPEATRKKVKIVSEGNTRKTLEKFIDLAELPKFVGGEKPDEESRAVPMAKSVPRQTLAELESR